MARLVPTNDAERNVLTYRSYEEPLGKAFKRYSDMTARGMMSKIGNVLSAAGYDGTNGLTVMNRQADPSTVRELEEIIHRAPEREQRRMMSKLYGDVGNGSLTVRKAIRDITEFGKYEHTLDLYKAGKKVLRDVATEGILRGEFMVQKQVGVAWKMDVPGTKAVDAFLKGKWAYNDVTSYLQPMSRIVRDEMAKGLLLGESPQKLANRWKNVEQINDVRAARNARTTVTAVANQAHADAYKRHGVKRYEFVATFDERTCIDCGKLDGKTFPIDSKIVGSNYPPIHPNCRCTTVAALSKELKEELYQNFKENGTGEEIDPRTTFEEWQKGNVQPETPGPKKEKTVQTHRREVKEKIIERKTVTAESYPAAFSKTKAEKQNTEAVAQYINAQEKADPKVVNLYGAMAKMETIETTGHDFKVAHGASSAVSYHYGFDGSLKDAKISYPKMRDADDVASVNTTLHEQMHLMDMYCRTDTAKAGGWFSTSRESLTKAVEETSKDMGPDSKELFEKFNADVKAEKQRLRDERDKKLDELDERRKAKEIDFKEYKKEWDRIVKECNQASDDYARSYDGGGYDCLQDIYDALSGGEYRDKGVVLYGHGGKYYRSKEDRVHEIVANYGALSISRPDLIEVLKKEKPVLVKELDEMVEAMLEKWEA